MKKNYIIITNNPLVEEEYRNDEEHEVLYQEISYEDVLKYVRDRVYEGYQLLSHPLSGSVKPNETPYKSVLISRKKGKLDMQSMRLIDNAIASCGKFKFKSDQYKEQVYKDFQLVDMTLIKSGIESADLW